MPNDQSSSIHQGNYGSSSSSFSDSRINQSAATSSTATTSPFPQGTESLQQLAFFALSGTSQTNYSPATGSAADTPSPHLAEGYQPSYNNGLEALLAAAGSIDGEEYSAAPTGSSVQSDSPPQASPTSPIQGAETTTPSNDQSNTAQKKIIFTLKKKPNTLIDKENARASRLFTNSNAHRNKGNEETPRQHELEALQVFFNYKREDKDVQDSYKRFLTEFLPGKIEKLEHLHPYTASSSYACYKATVNRSSNKDNAKEKLDVYLSLRRLDEDKNLREQWQLDEKTELYKMKDIRVTKHSPPDAQQSSQNDGEHLSSGTDSASAPQSQPHMSPEEKAKVAQVLKEMRTSHNKAHGNKQQKKILKMRQLASETSSAPVSNMVGQGVSDTRARRKRRRTMTQRKS